MSPSLYFHWMVPQYDMDGYLDYKLLLEELTEWLQKHVEKADDLLIIQVQTAILPTFGNPSQLAREHSREGIVELSCGRRSLAGVCHSAIDRMLPSLADQRARHPSWLPGRIPRAHVGAGELPVQTPIPCRLPLRRRASYPVRCPPAPRALPSASQREQGWY